MFDKIVIIRITYDLKSAIFIIWIIKYFLDMYFEYFYIGGTAP